MPTLDSTDKIASKSILRHRPIGEDTPDTNKRISLIHTNPPVVARASRPTPTDPPEVVAEWQQDKGNKEAPAVKTKPTQAAKPTQILHPRLMLTRSKMKRKHQAHPLFYLGAGMAVAMVLWILLSAVCSWFVTTLDDLHYGRPRTYQVDAWVGHNEQTGLPSHFMVVNLNRHIEIIEIPGGDVAHTRVYNGPQLYGSGDDLVPVTVRFVDVNSDHKPDMLVSFQGTHIVFINDQGEFRPTQPLERERVELFLRHLG